MGESVLVLGAGVIGLTSAILLQEAGFLVDIWARDLPPHTTSNKAGAYWYPYHSFPADKVRDWGLFALRYWQEKIQNDPRSGVIPGQYLRLLDTPEDPPLFAQGVQGFRAAQPSELPAGYKHGYVMDTIVMNPDITMHFLVNKFLSKGGRIQQKTIKDIAEAFVWFDCVVNCTGLGARELFNDTTLYAGRGQIVIIRKTDDLPLIVNDDSGRNNLAYIIPRQMDIVLGGTNQKDNESLLITEKDTKEILDRITGTQPHIDPKSLQVLGERVGLRPCRPSVRVEPEFFQGGRKIVVHNYGHGGSGWTLSWGCAQEVVELVQANIKKAKRHQYAGSGSGKSSNSNKPASKL